MFGLNMASVNAKELKNTKDSVQYVRQPSSRQPALFYTDADQ